MGILSDTATVERIQFFDGQQLLASDLQSVEQFNREMRWLHNSSLHQPGIGKGYAVYGRKGDRQITVKPGYALDALGREIVLTHDWTDQVPPVAGESDGSAVTYLLTVSYPGDGDLVETETREGLCLPGGAVRLAEQPLFCWVRLEKDAAGSLKVKDPQLASDIKAGLKITLAQAAVRNCQLDKDLSIAQRRTALPPRLPLIACDVVTPQWGQPVALTDPAGNDNTQAFLLRQTIDTTGAGFETVPVYQARLQAPRVVFTKINEASQAFAILDSCAVTQAEATQFSLELLLNVVSLGFAGSGDGPPVLTLAGGSAAATAAQLLTALLPGWQVAWMGVEG